MQGRPALRAAASSRFPPELVESLSNCAAARCAAPLPCPAPWPVVDRCQEGAAFVFHSLRAVCSHRWARLWVQACMEGKLSPPWRLSPWGAEIFKTAQHRAGPGPVRGQNAPAELHIPHSGCLPRESAKPWLVLETMLKSYPSSLFRGQEKLKLGASDTFSKAGASPVPISVGEPQSPRPSCGTGAPVLLQLVLGGARPPAPRCVQEIHTC